MIDPTDNKVDLQNEIEKFLRKSKTKQKKVEESFMKEKDNNNGPVDKT